MFSHITFQVPDQSFLVALYVSPMVRHPQKAELRYGTLTSGTQCVVITGTLLRQLLCAGNLGTTEQLLPIRMLILAKDQGESYWMIWTALVLRHLFSSVHTVGSTTTTVIIVKMQVWHVSENCTWTGLNIPVGKCVSHPSCVLLCINIMCHC